MNARSERTLAIVLKVLAISTTIGALIGLSRSSPEDTAITTLLGALTGAIIGLGCSVLEYLVFANTRFRFARRMPPVALGCIRATAFGCVIVIGLTAPAVIAGDLMPWEDPEFGEVFLISSGVAVAISTGIEVTRLLGSEATLALLSGRYNQPRLEDRVIVFADIIGSTGIAEKLGELEFHVFLQNVAMDLAAPIERARGNVHRYVGDAVIVTWPLKHDTNCGTYLTCALNMHRALALRAPVYRKRFGTVPKVRIAMHCGQVAAGEIGDWKKEIALLGDTMNTTARIEEAAKDMSETTVLSDAFADRLDGEVRSKLKRLPPFKAAGKSERLVLWAAAPPV